jgi:hypothetical protein
MCIPKEEYQYLNPTTQVALYSCCTEHCQTTDNITWNLYQGSRNTSLNRTEWTLMNTTLSDRDVPLFGKGGSIEGQRIRTFFMQE